MLLFVKILFFYQKCLKSFVKDSMVQFFFFFFSSLAPIYHSNKLAWIIYNIEHL